MSLLEKTKKRTIKWLVSSCVVIVLIVDSSLIVVVDAAQAEAAQEGRLDGFRMVMGALAGLVLFLYGVIRMSEGLKAIAGERMKELLGKFTTNRFAGVATGTVVTAVLDSSSITIILVVGLVNAGLLTFVQSLGVIMGANIGTTVGSQLIALEINEYAPLLLVVGAALHFLAKSEALQHAGLSVLGLGLIFFGLDEIGNAAEPLRNYQPFIDTMKRMEHPLMGALAGAGATLLIQSSSATVGIVITLASQGLITLPAGMAMMLGAEIGTCSDTLLATIGRSREAVRAGVFHLVFNIISVALGLIFIAQLARLATWLAFGGGVPRQIANGHVLFNGLSVLLFIWFTPQIAHALKWLIPDKAQPGEQTDSAAEPSHA
ncbi:MAG: Na/Pi cotransporter family protein [Pyrinomonadaceae bacterium]|nr:Na/Pi cotransporter family protein [Pyrinomonadaceae bacterium]